MAVVLTGIFPGLGQLYNRQWTKGVACIVIGLVLSAVVGYFTPTDPMAFLQPQRGFIVSTVVLLAFWTWALIDAWRAAGRVTPEVR